MTDETEHMRKRPRSRTMEEMPAKHKGLGARSGAKATDYPFEEAKAKLEVAYDEFYSHTQPSPRYSAQQPLFLNMIREMYRVKECQPVKLTPEVLEEVIERLWTGESLSAICQDDHIPAYKNLMKWMEIHPDVEAMIDKAKMRGTHALVDAAMDIVNGGPLSTGEPQRDAELVKLIKWILGRRNSFYNETIKIQHETEQRVFVLPEGIIPGVLIEDKSDEDGE